MSPYDIRAGDLASAKFNPCVLAPVVILDGDSFWIAGHWSWAPVVIDLVVDYVDEVAEVASKDNHLISVAM